MRNLTLKYRPSDFKTVCGQNIVTTILNKVIETKTFKNSILLCGPSGCGKTTLARIFASKVNNGQGEPIEIDAASHNGVDDIRAIVDDAKLRALDSEYKIYIIDECHMITTAGWNAFLKGIEEPAEYTIYIFCTTEPNKIPATILNRVQRYNLSKISSKEINERLQLICRIEKFTNYEATCDYISKLANGGMRDAINYLSTCADYSSDLSIENAKAVLGNMSAETMLTLTKALFAKDEKTVLDTIEGLYNNGRDLKIFLDSFLEFIIDLTKYNYYKDLSLTSIPSYLNDDKTIDKLVAAGCNLVWLNKVADLLLEIKTTVKYDDVYKATIEVYLLKMCRL